MPSKKSRTKKRRFDLSRLYPLLQVFLFFGAFANFLVIFFIERNRQPQIVNHEHYITTNHVIVVTNYISSASVPSFSSSSNTLSHSDVSLPYHYFIHNGMPAFRMFRRNFSIGSPTSYGRVKMIYPDRILLDDGQFIKNSTPESDEQPTKTQKQKELKNDRI